MALKTEQLLKRAALQAIVKAAMRSGAVKPIQKKAFSPGAAIGDTLGDIVKGVGGAAGRGAAVGGLAGAAHGALTGPDDGHRLKRILTHAALGAAIVGAGSGLTRAGVNGADLAGVAGVSSAANKAFQPGAAFGDVLKGVGRSAANSIAKNASANKRMVEFLKSAGCRADEIEQLRRIVKAASLMKKQGWVLPALAGIAGGAALGMGSSALQGMMGNLNQHQMPASRRALYGKIHNQAMESGQLSQDLQAIKGSFNPAPDPWGGGGQH